MEEILKFYSPLFSSFLILLLARRVRLGDRPLFSIEQFGLVISFNNNHVAKFAAIVVSFWPVPYYANLDFTTFFPQHLRMAVFYDQTGIGNALTLFSKNQLDDVGYVIGNEKFSSRYYELVDQKRFRIAGLPSFFSAEKGIVHSEGETSFIVEKISGFQSYHIKEAKGTITHLYFAEEQRSQRFSSFFERVPSRFDYIRPRLRDIFLDRSIAISPMFTQKVADYKSLEGDNFQSLLIGLTRLDLLPVPHFSDTLYFYVDPSLGAIPIAYAIYQ
jgi:hypothetical protein